MNAGPRNLYLVVGNEGRYAMLYCASPGLVDRVAQGHSQYWLPGHEVFVLGAASDIVPTGKVGMLDPMPGYVLDALRGLPDPEPTDVLSLDLPGSKKPKRRKASNG